MKWKRKSFQNGTEQFHNSLASCSGCDVICTRYAAVVNTAQEAKIDAFIDLRLQAGRKQMDLLLALLLLLLVMVVVVVVVVLMVEVVCHDG